MREVVTDEGNPQALSFYCFFLLLPRESISLQATRQLFPGLFRWHKGTLSWQTLSTGDDSFMFPNS